jgi:hypothetical protein
MTWRRCHVVALLGWAGAVAALEAAPPAALEALPVGTYRLEMRIGAHTAIPMIGSAETATVSLSRVEIRRHGDGLRQTHRVCATRFEGGVPIVRMVMPKRFIESLASHDYPLQVDYGANGWRYRADLGREHVGYTPDPNETLPREESDPAVIDSDGDGHPGATLELSIAGLAEGELYIVQRGHSSLEGNVVAIGQAAGRIDVRVFEQAVLGARPGFLRRQPAIELDPARSTFQLTRVAEGTPCERLQVAPYDPGTRPPQEQALSAGPPAGGRAR